MMKTAESRKQLISDIFENFTEDADELEMLTKHLFIQNLDFFENLDHFYREAKKGFIVLKNNK